MLATVMVHDLQCPWRRVSGPQENACVQQSLTLVACYEYGEQRMTRTLREVAHPKVLGAALWAAHAFMATCHIAASDRRSGRTTQDRQAAWLSRSSPAARQWLALRQESWPPSYRRERWIDVRELT